MNEGRLPLITIVTVCYNAEKELPATLQSIAAQTFRDFEHLIIDGASTDGTLDSVRRLATYPVSIHSEPDSGIYDGMNKGLRLARGKYILFLNAGDSFAAPDSLQRYADCVKANDADIIYGDTEITDAEGNIIGKRHLEAPRVLTVKSFSNGMLICHQAFMVRRDLAPSYDLRYRFSADYDWTVKCIKRTRPDKCCNLNAVTIHFLQGGATKKNKLRSLFERFVIMASHYGWTTTLWRHLSFVPRSLRRKLGIRN